MLFVELFRCISVHLSQFAVLCGLQLQAEADVVKYDAKIDEVKIKTADVSSKFKFFETYTPTKSEKKPFRITPPREGIVKVNDETDTAVTEQSIEENGHEYTDASVKAAKRSNTTSRMLSMFRQMEENERHRPDDGNVKPLKSFTPPPDDSRRFANRNSESGSEYTDSDGDDDTDDSEEETNGNDHHERRVIDQALQEAQAAARAKQLRAKFEKWEQKEIRREQEHLRLYDGEDQSQVENTQRYIQLIIISFILRNSFRQMSYTGVQCCAACLELCVI